MKYHLLLLTMSAVFATATSFSADAPERPNGSLSFGLNVLMIGDSNTEIGHISGGLARRMEEQFGYYGSGYRSLHSSIGMGSGYLPYLKLSHDSGWVEYETMGSGSYPKPHLSPDGTGLKGEKAGLATQAKFWGTAVDIFWVGGLSSQGGFSVEINGRKAMRVETGESNHTVQKTSLSGLEPGWHELRLITLDDSPVLLLGINPRLQRQHSEPIAVVHKWGKGWATSKDFAEIEETIFTSALEEVNPDIAVILLGTNDHNLAGHNRDQFAENIRTIVGRIHSAVPATRILLVSTAEVNSPFSNNGLRDYRKILPELSDHLGVFYWDMSAWFGPFPANKEAERMADDVHMNQKGGDLIAGQLFEEVLKIADRPSPQPHAGIGPTKVIGAAFPADAVPHTIPGLIGWWSAAGPVSVDASNRARQVADQSNRGRDAVAPWLASAPELIASVESGPAVLRFDGTANYLNLQLLSEAHTIMMVVRTEHLILGHPYFNTRPFHVATANRRKAFSTQYASKSLIDGKGFLNGQPLTLGDHAPATLQLDGKNFQILTLVPVHPTPFAQIGWGGSWNFDRYMKGDLAEILVFDRPLEAEERERIEADIISRWRKLPGLSSIGPSSI